MGGTPTVSDDERTTRAGLVAVSEARFRAVLDSAPDAIMAHDRHGRIFLANARAEKAFGYGPDELLGNLVELLITERYRRLHLDHRLSCLTSPRSRPMAVSIDLCARRRDGSEFPVQVSLNTVDLAGEEAVMSIIRDVSERKPPIEIAPDLRAADRFLFDLTDSLTSSLQSTTLEDIAHLGLPFLGDSCVLELFEEQRRPARVFIGDVEAQREQALTSLWEALMASGLLPNGVADLTSLVAVPMILRLSVGSSSPLVQLEPFQAIARHGYHSILILPMMARQRIFGRLWYLLARSDRSYDDAELGICSEAARRIALTIDNLCLYQEAQAEIRLRDRMLTAISHDLRNPLMIIRLLAEGTRRQVQRKPRLSVRRLIGRLERIEHTTRKISTQVDELLDLAQLHVGQEVSLTRRPLDLVALIRNAVDEFQQTTDRHRIQFVAGVDELLGRWDENRLDRVIGNLLSNAIKYSVEEGNILVRISQEQENGAAWAIVSVQDHGVGIPPGEIGQVFSWFFRGTNVADKIAGTGVGLAGARHIVELHGGSMLVSSEVGVGTTFTVRLPLSASGRELT